MAATKKTTANPKKKKSRRYLKKAARRTIAALLMVTALIVAAIPARTSRAAEEGGDASAFVAAGTSVVVHKDNMVFNFTATGNSNHVRLDKIYKEDPGASFSAIDISGSLTGEDSETYVCTEIGPNALSATTPGRSICLRMSRISRQTTWRRSRTAPLPAART